MLNGLATIWLLLRRARRTVPAAAVAA